MESGKKMKRKLILTAGYILIITGCGNSVPQLPDTPDFKAGYADGCATAEGNYTKDSERFRAVVDYHEGWFAGRKACNPSSTE
jgi:hypothetical protein